MADSKSAKALEVVVGALVVFLIAVAILAIEPFGGPIKRFLLPDGRTWIELATAVGTCAAAIVALWLAGSSRRREDLRRMDIAELVASEISVRLARATTSLDGICNRWKQDLKHVILSDFQTHIGALEEFVVTEYQKLDRRTLAELTPLPEMAARRIARAQDYLGVCEHEISRTRGIFRVGELNMRFAAYTRLGKLARAAHVELAHASRVCAAAAEIEPPEADPS